MLGFCPADAGQECTDALARWIAVNYQDAPDQCSPDLFWLVTDHLAQVPVTLAEPPVAVLPEQLLRGRRRSWFWRR
jgi:hypothetical protein